MIPNFDGIESLKKIHNDGNTANMDNMSQPTTSSCNQKKKRLYFLALMMTFANKVAKFRTTFQFSEFIRILLVITHTSYKTMHRQQSMKTSTDHHRRCRFAFFFPFLFLMQGHSKILKAS